MIGLLLTCLSVPLNSVYATGNIVYAKSDDIVIHAEETEWRYRVVDGKLQKRLWSITRGMWLTNWEWV